MTKSILVEKSIEFSKEILPITKALRDANHHILAEQLFRSATSIGASIHEAQASESIKDFIHKLKIANKEAWETDYWLKLTRSIMNFPPEIEMKRAIIHKMINKSITTAQKNAETRN